MSDKHTGYRVDSNHAASDEEYQYIDPRTGQPVQQRQHDPYGRAEQTPYAAGYHSAGHAEQAAEAAAYQQYQSPEAQAYYHAHGQAADAGHAGYAANAEEQYAHAGHAAAGHHAYGQHAEGHPQHTAAEAYYEAHARAGAQQPDVDSYYAAAHQNATPPYEQRRQQEDATAYQDHAYYTQAQVDTGQAPALYGQQDALAYAGAYGAGHEGYAHAQEGYAHEGQAYEQQAYDPSYDYSQYGQQGVHPQGMAQLNDPYAPTPLHQAQADTYYNADTASSSGRKSFLVGAMILGSVIVGGGVATAYKYSGDGVDGNRAPVIVSDGANAKVAPDNPGGKVLSNKDKKIFARLGDKGVLTEGAIVTTGDPDVAGKLRGEIKETGSLDKKQLAAGDDVGGPRLVKTYKFNRNGEQIVDDSVVVTTGQDVKDIAGVGVDTGKPPLAVKTLRAGAVRTDALAEKKVAALDSTGVVSTDGNYVVQISARRSQQDALASFSGLQDKYGDVLSGYRPLIQRADLGSKGVFYRLRVGPMKDKELASSVCSKLKSKGLPSCFVTDR